MRAEAGTRFYRDFFHKSALSLTVAGRLAAQHADRVVS